MTTRRRRRASRFNVPRVTPRASEVRSKTLASVGAGIPFSGPRL